MGQLQGRPRQDDDYYRDHDQIALAEEDLHEDRHDPSHSPSPSPPPRPPSDPRDYPAAMPAPSFRQSFLAGWSPSSIIPHTGALPSNVLAQPPAPTTFPHLTMQQLQQLRDANVDFDMAFVPYQMPRLTSHNWGEEQKEKEKKCVRIQNPMAIKTTQLIPPPPPPSSSSALSPSPPSSPPPLSQFSLSITFDTTVPCRLSIFPCATELIDRSQPDQLPSFSPHPDCHIHSSEFESGLNQSLSVPLHALFSADILSQRGRGGGRPSLWSFSSSRHYFPLIIHLERLGVPMKAERGEERKEAGEYSSVDHLIAYLSLTESASSSSPSNSSAPSAAGEPSTTTSWGVKRLKQKVKVGTKSFEIAEVYGLPPPPAPPSSSSTSPPPPPAASAESAECVICLTARRTHAIFPCRHLCLCGDCAGLLREQTNKCPICRRGVEMVLPILVDPTGVEPELEAVSVEVRE